MILRNVLFFRSLLFRQFCHLLEPRNHIIIATGAVGNQTARAVLYSLICIGTISPAFIPKGIQRTIAEQTVEIAAVQNLMTGKIFTVSVLKKATGMFHKFTSKVILLYNIISRIPISVNSFSGNCRKPGHKADALWPGRITIPSGACLLQSGHSPEWTLR